MTLTDNTLDKNIQSKKEKAIVQKSYTMQDIRHNNDLSASIETIVSKEIIDHTPLPETVKINEKSRGSSKKDPFWFSCLLACFLCCVVKNERSDKM